jgi:glyoxylase-like metal-dependent hydrolase (beta-lactamase superfamily II)
MEGPAAMLRLGRYQLASVTFGTFAVDGGAMFGVVPRPLWERKVAPDARHRVTLMARGLLAVDRDAGRVILVDAGPSARWDDRQRDRLALEPSSGDVAAALARVGQTPADVTDVVLTHLHFDHAGGVCRPRPEGGLTLTFPRAVHHLQRSQWHWAQAPAEKDQESFRPEEFELLAHSAQLHLLDGEEPLFPDVELIVSEGHTVGQQLPRFHDDRTHLTCCGDLVPTVAHLRPTWVAAYDLHPLTAIEEKKVLLAEALEDDGILALGHDAAMAACRLEEHDGRPVFREAVAL